jgi:hypothetical protein
LAYIFAKFLEGFYSVHIKVRYLHDKVYARDGAYKKWSDKPYSRSVHRGLLLGFVVSFIIFSTLTNLFPDLFDISKPRTAQAGSNSVTWTTKEDFSSALLTNQVNFSGDNDLLDQNNNDFAEIQQNPEALSGSGISVLSESVENRGISLAMDSDRKVHIAYRTGGALKYATNSGGAMQHYTIQEGGYIGRYPSIGVDSNKKVHIIYGESPVNYATNASGVWVTAAITTGYCYGASLSIDSSNKVHVVYYGDSGLRYGTNTSGVWAFALLASNADYERVAIALDSNNKAHVAYYNTASNDLSYQNNSSGSWLSSTLDSVGSVGQHPSIAVDSQNKIHISYYDVTNANLKYATNRSGSWSYSALESVGTVGQYSSLYLDKDNSAHITYKNSTNNTINYATNRSGSWDYSVIDSGIGTGNHSSIAHGPFSAGRRDITGYDSIHVAYIAGNTAKYYNNVSPYYRLGTMGDISQGGNGYIVDTGQDNKSKPSLLSWMGRTSEDSQKIMLKVRVGDSQAELGTNQCYGPSALDSGCSDWSTVGKFFSQTYNVADPPNPLKSATSIFNQIPAKRYIEVLVRLESDGSNTPILDDVTLTYDTLESPQNSNLSLQKTNGDTLNKSDGVQLGNGVSGGWTNETTLKVVAANLTCTVQNTAV